MTCPRCGGSGIVRWISLTRKGPCPKCLPAAAEAMAHTDAFRTWGNAIRFPTKETTT